MPVYEFECRDCMLTYNKEIDKLVKNLNKKYAENPFGEKPIVSTFHLTIFDFLMSNSILSVAETFGVIK